MVQVILTTKDELSTIVKLAVQTAIDKAVPTASTDNTTKDKIYGIKEAVQFLGIAKPTIYAKTSKGEIPHFKRAGRLYFRESELIQWIEEGRQNTVEDEAEAMDNYLANKKGATRC